MVWEGPQNPGQAYTLQLMLVLLRDRLIQADALDSPLRCDPDGFRTFEEYLPFTGTKHWEEKALRWILDPLGSFE